MTTTARDWVAGARPRTLSTAVAPVAVGTGAAVALDAANLLLALLALGVALALQVAVNYANDYSDGVRGTDANRIGPERLTASGKARPSSVKRAAYAAFAVAALLGLALTWLSGQWWLVAAGVVAIAAAWGYTGTSRPYGYAGWGEVGVFVFFGLLATLGTLVAQAGAVTWWAVVAAAAVGLHACALLVVNNLRDVATDAATGKRTLAVRLGEVRTRRLLALCILLPFALALAISVEIPWVLVTMLLALPAALLALGGLVRRLGVPGPVMFKGVSGLALVFGLLLAFALALG